MSDTTGAALTLAAGSVVFANEWIQTPGGGAGSGINWRIVVATPLATLFMWGIGKVSSPISTGLGVALFITAMVTPINGSSPAQTLAGLTKGNQVMT